MFVAAVTGYLVLIVTVLARWIRPREAARDVRGEGFALFAFTAASGVLGAWFSALDVGWAATVLTVVAAISWAILGYLVFGIAVVRLTDESSARQRITGGRPRGLARVDGTWFLLVVATQSVAVASGALATAAHRPGFALLAAICWCIGLLQLGLIAALMTARLLIVPLTVSDEVAPYWVFMGAGAISVLAGDEILATSDQQTFLDGAFIGSVCMVLWSFATWLIPLLVIMVIWHGMRRDTYAGFRTALWSMVFPVGMYGEASRQLGVMRGIDWLEELGTGEAWIAFAMWLSSPSGCSCGGRGGCGVLRWSRGLRVRGQ